MERAFILQPKRVGDTSVVSSKVRHFHENLGPPHLFLTRSRGHLMVKWSLFLFIQIFNWNIHSYYRENHFVPIFISPMTGNTLFLRIPRILWVQTFKKAFWNQGIARNLILGRPDREKNNWIALQATMTPRPETLFSVSKYLRSSYQQLFHLRLGPSKGFFTHDTAPFKGLRLALKIASKTTEIQGHHEVGEPR